MDARLDAIVSDMQRTDNSFKEKETMLSLLFGGHKYTQSEARDIWFKGIRHGIEQGLFMASLEGQKIQIDRNISNDRHKEFYEKFLELAHHYGCQIQYHPVQGMCVIDLRKTL